VPIVTLRPIEATPAMLTSAIRNVVGEAPVQMGKVKIDIPPLVENGNTVPMTVSVTSPMIETDYVKSIHVFNEKNPQPNIGNFYIGPWPAGRRSQPESGWPTARRSWRSRTCPTIASGR
jgi:sulfur-oxidizing protein SoxY